VASNIALVVEQGRDPNLVLSLEGSSKPMQEWANELLGEISFSASMLDHIHTGNAYESSLNSQLAKVADPNLTPSGRILKDMREGQMSFFDFSMQQSRNQRDILQNGGLSEDTAKLMWDTSIDSLARQLDIEAADTVSFDDFLADWNKG